MFNRSCTAAACFLTAALLLGPAQGAVIVITQTAAMNGGVTPGDDPGSMVTRAEKVPNGFRLYGWNSANSQRVANYGVHTTFGVGKIHDGFISGFRLDGISFAGTSNQWVIENMTIQSNGGSGIFGPSFVRIINNIVNINLGGGINCQSICHAEGNLVANNVFYGIYLETGLVLGHTIIGNGGYGIVNNGNSSDVGFGNNVLIGNNSGGAQIGGSTSIALHPNACSPAC